MPMVVVKEYEQKDGKHPFSIWFDSLNVQAALKVRTAIARNTFRWRHQETTKP